nr:restriction endonuclease subunit S [uncultured Cohaesibacter sp.]
MRAVALGDICQFKYGKSLPKKARETGKICVYGSNGIVDSHNAAITDGPTIVIGRKGSIGEVNFSDTDCWPIDTTYFVDTQATEQDLRWLFYVLKHLRLQELNKSAAIPGLNRNDAYERKIPLPPLEEQKRIAAILDQADSLRRSRAAALEKLNGLGQAIFHEMFGDVVSNSAGWNEELLLGEVSDIMSGITKGRKTNGRVLSEVPYLAVANVQDKHLKLDVVKTIEATEEEIDRYRLATGDLLLTEGGDPDKLGRGTLWNSEIPDCIYQNHVFRVRLTSEEIRPVFLNWIVGSARGKRYFLRSSKQTTGIASINKTQLMEFPLLVPPKPLQVEFENRLRALELLQNAHVSAAEKGQALFSSLQHRAFRGEL